HGEVARESLGSAVAGKGFSRQALGLFEFAAHRVEPDESLIALRLREGDETDAAAPDAGGEPVGGDGAFGVAAELCGVGGVRLAEEDEVGVDVDAVIVEA